MALTREFESSLRKRYLSKEFTRTIYPCLGQEACGIGVGQAAQDTDWLLLPHRCLHYVIGRGVPLDRVAQEIYGRKPGCTGGGGGRYVCPERGIPGYTGAVGGNFAIAVGLALAASRQGSGQVCVCVFGDGAASRGTFHSALNFSSIWKLPVLWICENNQYSVATPVEKLLAAASVVDFARPYGIWSLKVNGNSVLSVYNAVRRSLSRVRGGGGPGLIELRTYRLGPHESADLQGCQPEEEIMRWRKRDPIQRIENLLLKLGWMDRSQQRELQGDCREEAAGLLDALASPVA